MKWFFKDLTTRWLLKWVMLLPKHCSLYHPFKHTALPPRKPAVQGQSLELLVLWNSTCRILPKCTCSCTWGRYTRWPLPNAGQRGERKPRRKTLLLYSSFFKEGFISAQLFWRWAYESVCRASYLGVSYPSERKCLSSANSPLCKGSKSFQAHVLRNRTGNSFLAGMCSCSAL